MNYIEDCKNSRKQNSASTIKNVIWAWMKNLNFEKKKDWRVPPEKERSRTTYSLKKKRFTIEDKHQIIVTCVCWLNKVTSVTAGWLFLLKVLTSSWTITDNCCKSDFLWKFIFFLSFMMFFFCLQHISYMSHIFGIFRFAFIDVWCYSCPELLL